MNAFGLLLSFAGTQANSQADDICSVVSSGPERAAQAEKAKHAAAEAEKIAAEKAAEAEEAAWE